MTNLTNVNHSLYSPLQFNYWFGQCEPSPVFINTNQLLIWPMWIACCLHPCGSTTDSTNVNHSPSSPTWINGWFDQGERFPVFTNINQLLIQPVCKSRSQVSCWSMLVKMPNASYRRFNFSTPNSGRTSEASPPIGWAARFAYWLADGRCRAESINVNQNTWRCISP